MDVHILDIQTEKRHLGDLGARFWKIAGAAGAALLVIAAALGLMAGDHGRSFFFAYLIGYAFALSLALGALFFVMIQHLTHAGWSVVVRRVAEAVAGTLPLLALLFVPILFGMHELYHWTHGDAVAADPILQHKAPYLNVPFFLVRWVIYLAVWSLLAQFFVGRSIAQDADGDPRLTLRMQKLSAPGMVVYGLTVTFAAFDLIMSLDPHWFSTIFGVYFFAGSLVGFLALLPLLIYLLQKAGLVRHAITIEHYHDLGKLLFAFTVFWAYIAFSQYMLIWYANLPEETGWLFRRQSMGWGPVGLALILGHFLVPFLALLSRSAKRTRWVLATAAVWMLVMHLVDVFWLIKPEASPQGFSLHPLDVLVPVAMLAILLAAAAFRVRGRSLIPERDPRLAESLAFENA